MKKFMTQKLKVTTLFIFIFPFVLLIISFLKGDGKDFSVIGFIIGNIVAVIMYLHITLSFLLFINFISVLLEHIFSNFKKDKTFSFIYILFYSISGIVFSLVLLIIYSQNIPDNIKIDILFLGGIAATTYGILDVLKKRSPIK